MTNSKVINVRANALAERLIKGANNLANFAEELTDDEWNIPVKGDGRSIGVVVHHVANVYPLEIELAKLLAAGNPITGATMNVIDKMNADHAKEFTKVTKPEAIELLKLNSKLAADAVRTFTDKELDNSSTVSLNADAPLTAQFFVEDHALRHSYHHLSKIKETLNR